MRLFEILHFAKIAAGILRRHRRGNSTLRKAAAFVLRQFHDLVMADRAGRNQRHATGTILRPHIAAQHGGIERGDGFFVAQDGPAQRLAGKDRRLQMVEHDVVGRVAHLPQLLQHDLALALQLGRLEARVGENVADHVQRQRHVFLQHAGVKGCLFAAGVSVEHAAHGLDLFGDLAGTARGRALERHMLQHVGNAHLGGRFIATAGINPDAQSGAFDPCHGIADDRQAIGKFGDFQGHPASLEEMNCFIKAASLPRIFSFSGRFFMPASRLGSEGGVPIA